MDAHWGEAADEGAAETAGSHVSVHWMEDQGVTYHSRLHVSEL